MLSYHGNDHYNSVRSIRACPSSLGGTIDDRRGGEGQLRSSKESSASRSAESGRGDGEDGDADDANKDDARGSDDGMEGGAKAGARRSDRRIVCNEGRRRPPARGSVCPCGSGKKYKKCCSAKDKIETRRSTTRLLQDGSIAPNEDGNARESCCDKDEEKDGAEEFIGSFKVLAI